MRLQKIIPAILIFILFISANRAIVIKPNHSRNPKACTYALRVNNSGTSTITSVVISWPGHSAETFNATILPSAVQVFYPSYNANYLMKYPVTVTINWAPTADRPYLRLTTNSDSKLIGTNIATGFVSSLSVTGSSGATAIYCQGVTVNCTEP